MTSKIVPGAAKPRGEPKGEPRIGQDSAIQSILVRAPNWIGDQILAYPFFYYLKKIYPNARIASACVPWVESAQFLDLIDEVHVLPKSESSGVLAQFKALESGAALLRAAGPWDLAISLPNSFSAAWTLFRAGAKRRRGFSLDARSFMLNERMDWKPHQNEHRSSAYLGLLPETLGTASKRATEFFGVAAENDLDSDLPGEVSEFNASRSWPNADPVEPPPGNYWVLAPGAAAESRRWSLESYRELARLVSEATGWKGVVVGGLSELPLANALCSDSDLKLIDMCAQGSAASLWRVFRGARFTISNDSGLAHVASLCGSPVQVVWGAGQPSRTRPIGPGRVRVIFNPIECWPCESNDCALISPRKNECLRGISPESVWKEVQSGFFRS